MNPWLLFLIGMSTVIVVLIMVMMIGKSVIILANRWPADKKQITSNPIPPHHLAAVVSAVDWITTGEGRVTKVNPKEK